MVTLQVDMEALHAQQRHWDKMYVENPDMFGKDPSYPALRAAEIFAGTNAKKILELGSGQGRDTLFFARHGFQVYALDYSEEGLDAIQQKAHTVDLSASLATIYHDVRQPLPFVDNSLDACYSHMLYCMPYTSELEFLSRENPRSSNRCC